MTRVILSIRGLHSNESAWHVERSLRATQGVRGVEADVLARCACVEHDETTCSLKDLIAAVMAVGFQVDGYEAAEIYNN